MCTNDNHINLVFANVHTKFTDTNISIFIAGSPREDGVFNAGIVSPIVRVGGEVINHSGFSLFDQNSIVSRDDNVEVRRLKEFGDEFVLLDEFFHCSGFSTLCGQG